MVISSLYGPHYAREREDFWNELRQLKQGIYELVVGEFNITRLLQTQNANRSALKILMS